MCLRVVTCERPEVDNWGLSIVMLAISLDTSWFRRLLIAGWPELVLLLAEMGCRDGLLFTLILWLSWSSDLTAG